VSAAGGPPLVPPLPTLVPPLLPVGDGAVAEPLPQCTETMQPRMNSARNTVPRISICIGGSAVNRQTPVASAERRGHLCDAAPLHEPHLDHAALGVRQAVDELKEADPFIQTMLLVLVGHVGRLVVQFAPVAAPMVSQGVCCNAEQPRGERCAAPFEPLQVRERLLEDGGGHVLGCGPVTCPPAYVCVHAIDVPVVQIDESRRIPLGRLDQRPFVVCARRHLSFID